MNKKEQEITLVHVIGGVVLGFMLVVMLMQGDRLWLILERLTVVETKVEMNQSD